MINLYIKLSILTLIISFPIIFYIENFTLPETKNIEDITLFDINKPVKIKAIPIQQNTHKGHLTFKLKQNNSEIDAILFEHNKTLTKKESIFIAKISQYQSNPQLQIKKVIPLKNSSN